MLPLVAAFATLAVPAHRPTQAQLPPDAMDVQRRVERVLGGPAADCGRFFFKNAKRPAASAGELRNAIACVTEHAATRTPAWMVQQMRGIDSWVARGLMARPDGKVELFGYDSDPAGGGGAAPRFTTQACESPRVRNEAKTGPALACGTAGR